MRFYNKEHRYYCGIDLHARTMYACILDQAGETLVHQNLPAEPDAFLKVIAAYRDDIAAPSTLSLGRPRSSPRQTPSTTCSSRVGER